MTWKPEALQFTVAIADDELQAMLDDSLLCRLWWENRQQDYEDQLAELQPIMVSPWEWSIHRWGGGWRIVGDCFAFRQLPSLHGG